MSTYEPLFAGHRRAIRRKVIAAHGLVCWLCRRTIEPGEVTMDHVRPISLGGRFTVENLRPAHKECNQQRGAASLHKGDPT